MTTYKFIFVACVGMLLSHTSLGTEKTALEIVGKYSAIWKAPPTRIPANHAVDGPLMGNGDMTVALGGPAEEQSFYLAKNDLWRLASKYGSSSPVGFGRLAIRIPELAGAEYQIEQKWANPRTVGSFTKGGTTVHMTSMVVATRNLLIVELKAEGSTVEGEILMHVASGRGSRTEARRLGKVYVGQRMFSKDVDIKSGAAVAWKVLKNNAQVRPVKQGESPSLGLAFTLKPGRPLTLVMSMDSVFKSDDCEASAIRAVADLSSREDLRPILKAHAAWWARYWAKSFVEMGDTVIEQHYYRSLYSMGILSRDPTFPPGIFGISTTDRPKWLGDYHLNYNHMAPFYGLARANRLEQADPHDAPILDFLERANWHCNAIFGFEGAIYPVGIGPKGIETTYGNEKYIKQGDRFAENGGLFFGQRTNGSYALVNMAPRWYTTYDPAYGKKIYPLVSRLAAFWENYIVWDEANQRFIIDKDSVHEGSGKDVNSIVSLGLARYTFQLALDLSQELNVDTARQKTWNHILEHLSDYSFQQKDGKKVFRYTEKGTAWWKSNTLGIQHIYPAGQIGLDSDPELLEVSRNTISVMQRWMDFNGSNSFFPAAVRVGYDADAILNELRAYCQNTYPNGFQLKNPHGIENFSTVPNTIHEMLCMGHDGVLRLFPVWPKQKEARFVRIRCRGAFLVSGTLQSGEVTYVEIISERGRQCTMINPWADGKVQLVRNGKQAEILEGKRFTFDTDVKETIRLLKLR